MKITRENCEAWFLDYYEGRLEPLQADMLFAFLDLHPDLHEVFNSFEAITLDDLSVTFDHKDELKHLADLPPQINEINCEEIFIADAEGMLDAAMKVQLVDFLQQHPELRHTYETYLKTRLQPETIVFEEKSILKKTAAVSDTNFITAENQEQWFAAFADGTLTAGQNQQLTEFIKKHPEAQAELVLFAQTVLTPDLSVVYPNKAALKRSEKGFVFFTGWRAAAAVALFIVSGFGIYQFSTGPAVSGNSVSLVSNHNGRNFSKHDILNSDPSKNTNVAAVKNSNPVVKKDVPDNNGKQIVPGEWLAFQGKPVNAVLAENKMAAGSVAVDAQAGSSAFAAAIPKTDENQYPSIAKLASDWVVERFEIERPEVENPVGVNALNEQKPDGWDWTSSIVKKVSKGKVLIKTRKTENGKRRFDVSAWKYRFTNIKS